MKKLYKKPEIEAVCYTANSELCGSCGANIYKNDDLELLAMILGKSTDVVISAVRSGQLFITADACSDSVEGFGFEGLCHFNGDLRLFLS